MPVLATGNRGGNAANGNNSDANQAPSGAQQPAMVVPFVRASDENLQPGNIDVQRLMTANAQDLGVMDLPAYGYVSHIYLLVEGTGGAGTGAVLTEDGPYNVLQNIALTEPNGAYIDQFTNGWELYMANKWGGYLPPVSSDAERSPVFTTVTAAGNFKFVLRIPVSVSNRDAVGSLPNQDSAGQFKFRATIAPSATLFATPPSTTLPTVRVRAWLASWDQPEPTSAGVGNQVEPPASGTTSFWSVQSGITVNAGENTIEIKRKGNYLRALIFVFRSSASRATGEANWPTELRFLRDSFPARYYNYDIMRHIMYERTGYTGTNDTAGALDNGVRVHDYMHEFDGALGRENRDLWQPTRGSTRLEVAGNFGASGTLTIITNDVAIAQNVFL
jgi:hypothetical protein